jgi:DNA replication protein DnaC
VPLPQLLNFQLARDLVVLDELGHLSFAQTGGQLLFHLVSKLCERTWVIVTTNLAFGPGTRIPVRSGRRCQSRGLHPVS